MAKPTRESHEKIKEYLCVIDNELDALQAENLAQEEELEKERNFVEAHRLLVQELKAENRALKAKLAGTFKFDEPKRGEILRYTTDGATGDEGEDGGQP